MRRCSLSRLTALAAAAALTACSVVGSAPMLEYTQVSGVHSAATGALPCASRLGSYSLPKSLLHVVVLQPVGGGVNSVKVEQADKKVPDNRHTYCLDHLASAFADDTVRVFKERVTATDSTPAKEATPFLQLVASNAVDQTATIIRKLIRTAFILISGNPNFAGARSAVGGGAATEVVRDLTFDPFDQQEVAEINQSIAPLGFCVVLGDYSYDIDAISIDAYCAAPQKAEANHPSRTAEIAASQRYLVPKPKSGIFYRPRANYPVSVYVKADPGSSERWRLAQMQYFAFENISPVISVGIDRAVFATRRTGLVFKDGVLTDVCLAKGSEAASFVNIPLDVVYGIIALPTQTIQASVNSNKTRRDLITAQNDLVEAQKAYIAYLKDSGNRNTPNIPQHTDAQPLKLGATVGGAMTATGVPAPQGTVALADYGAALSGDTALISGDAVLKDICPELLKANVGTVQVGTRPTTVQF
ncbi:hypothetical protein [Mesorhizobium sp. GbtcB19]|uniref:hypothetical protein n=1 Tax=Mesorhizobium sp. GbtcB19 TaxID=2824764 RepID=UPI001C2FDE39|nr:hypothetical protein [Mesorhizobium sp. GbtcB19]